MIKSRLVLVRLRCQSPTPRPHAFIEKIIINSDRSFFSLALLINVCSPILSVAALFPGKLGRESLCPYMFFTLRLLSFTAKWLNNLVYSSETEFDKGINRNKANFFQLLSCVRWRKMHPYRLQANKIYVFVGIFHSCFSHSFPGLKSWNACPTRVICVSLKCG